MRRRNFIKSAAVALAMATTVKANASAPPADWYKIADETNTFSSSDTIQQRLEKFNQLTGMNVSLGYIGAGGRYVRTNKFYGEKSCGRRCLVYADGCGTGYMDRETMMHWTAQVALGYRIARAQHRT